MYNVCTTYVQRVYNVCTMELNAGNSRISVMSTCQIQNFGNYPFKSMEMMP